jgi:hypothetical protein
MTVGIRFPPSSVLKALFTNRHIYGSTQEREKRERDLRFDVQKG